MTMNLGDNIVKEAKNMVESSDLVLDAFVKMIVMYKTWALPHYASSMIAVELNWHCINSPLAN